MLNLNHMGARSATTLKKRQKELARMEKQRDKAAKKLQRKADKANGIITPDDDDAVLTELDDNPEEETKPSA